MYLEAEVAELLKTPWVSLDLVKSCISTEVLLDQSADHCVIVEARSRDSNGWAAGVLLSEKSLFFL